jgi:energy-coupling factor transporter ATP-binding protein EcfA2
LKAGEIMSVDSAFASFERLLGEFCASTHETEADTRFQIIDRILQEVLGWEDTDFKLEPHLESGYADYILKDKGTNKLVVEAKRSSQNIFDSKRKSYGTYKASGPTLRSAIEGMKQAQSYCMDTGVTFSVLTTGYQWVGFWAIRENGKPPFEGNAAVFPTLDSIKEDFSVFYDLFSKEGIREQLFKIIISSSEGLSIVSNEKLEALTGPESISLLKRSALASDIEILFKKFFSDISGDENAEMLAECFVESKESKEAEVGIEKIARNILENIGLVDSKDGGELQDKMRMSLERESRDFVLIVGNKGAGKSTFIDRFFRLVLEKDLRGKCLILRLNLADSDGNEAKISEWLSKCLVKELEKQLFGDEGPKYDDLLGVFFDEYNRWLRGEYKYLYESDKNQFKIEFGKFVYKYRNEDHYNYALKLLSRSVNSNKKMPCIVFDNTDHYQKSFQESVFQYAQSINRAVHSFIICPITDRTVWQLSKAGPFQSYHTHSFYLPVPQAKEILKKRVWYLKNKVDEETKKEKKDYTLNRGIRLQINDLRGFVACIEEIFVNTDYVSRTISWLSNHDIRRGLRIAERIITSPLISVENLIKTWVAGNTLNIPEMKVRQALLYGNYTLFNQEHSEYILNLFSVSSKNITSPLLKPSILRLLMDVQYGANSGEEEYLGINDIRTYFDSCGVPAVSIQGQLKELLEYRLVEPYDPTDEDLHDKQRIRITHSGHIHYEFVTQGFIYFQNMAMITPIRSMLCIDKMKRVSNKKMTRDDWTKLKSIFAKYLLDEDKLFIHLPNLEEYKSQTQLRLDLRAKWVAPT